jgi:hypothetical protein
VISLFIQSLFFIDIWKPGKLQFRWEMGELDLLHKVYLRVTYVRASNTLACRVEEKTPQKTDATCPSNSQMCRPFLLNTARLRGPQLNIQCSYFLARTMNCKKNWRFLFQISCDLALPFGRSALLMDLWISPTDPLSHLPKSLLSYWVWKYSSHKKQRRESWAGKAEENGKKARCLQHGAWSRATWSSPSNLVSILPLLNNYGRHLSLLEFLKFERVY